MKPFFWIAFVIVAVIAVFAVQNSAASPVLLRFLFWKFETSLVYTILGAIGLGIFLTLLFWIPREIRSYLRRSKPQSATPPASPSP